MMPPASTSQTLPTATSYRLALLALPIVIVPAVALAILAPAASIYWFALLWAAMAATALAALFLKTPGARPGAFLGALSVFAIAGTAAALLWRHTDGFLLQKINNGLYPWIAWDVAWRDYLLQTLPACLAGACYGLGLFLVRPGRATVEAAILLLALAGWLGLHAAL